MKKKRMTVKEACKQLGFSDSTFRRKAKDGEFKEAGKVGRSMTYWVEVPNNNNVYIDPELTGVELDKDTGKAETIHFDPEEKPKKKKRKKKEPKVTIEKAQWQKDLVESLEETKNPEKRKLPELKTEKAVLAKMSSLEKKVQELSEQVSTYKAMLSGKNKLIDSLEKDLELEKSQTALHRGKIAADKCIIDDLEKEKVELQKALDIAANPKKKSEQSQETSGNKVYSVEDIRIMEDNLEELRGAYNRICEENKHLTDEKLEERNLRAKTEEKLDSLREHHAGVLKSNEYAYSSLVNVKDAFQKDYYKSLDEISEQKKVINDLKTVLVSSSVRVQNSKNYESLLLSELKQLREIKPDANLEEIIKTKDLYIKQVEAKVEELTETIANMANQLKKPEARRNQVSMMCLESNYDKISQRVKEVEGLNQTLLESNAKLRLENCGLRKELGQSDEYGLKQIEKQKQEIYSNMQSVDFETWLRLEKQKTVDEATDSDSMEFLTFSQTQKTILMKG